MPAKSPLITLEKVSKSYSPYMKALDGVSLRIARGEFVFITGPSGAGKTTLLNLIFGLDRPTSGKIFFKGTDYASLKRKGLSALRRRMGFVFQDFKLLQDKTVYENVYLGLEVLGVPEREAEKRIEEVLARLGLAGRKHLKVRTLSGGEKQRVAIARAIVREPELILADEPTGNLDPRRSQEILEIMEELNAEGITVLFATHDENLYKNRHRRVVVLDRGKVVRDGV